MNLKINTPFWITTIALFTVLVCPQLIQDGMFMDGQQYAIVSKNLSDGLGTFWFPFLSETWMKNGSPYFMEHPPLIYGIQSLFFTLFGDSLYVERFYSFLCAILTAYVISLIWKLLFKNHKGIKKLNWLPILFWFITPVVYWTYQNNLHENTMGFFTLLSIYFVLKSFREKSHSLIWIFLAGITLFMASFSKGVPGLFPIVSVAIYWLVFRNISFKKIVLYSLILIAIPLFIYTILLINENASESLMFYFNERLLHRIENEGVVDNRFYSAGKIVLELLPAIIITLLFFLIGKKRKMKSEPLNDYRKEALFFFIIGLSASLPLMLTPVQRGFYLVPSIPFYSIALAIIAFPTINQLIYSISTKSKGFKIFLYSSCVFLLFSITFSFMQIGKIGRDHDMLNDVYKIGEKVEYGSSFKVSESTYETWNLQFYLLRYFGISMGASVENSPYLLIEKSSTLPLPEEFKLIPLETKSYDLYKEP